MIDWTQCPESGRRGSLLRTLRMLHDGEPVRIVEVGTIRSAKRSAMERGGWATRVFAWYVAHVGGEVLTVDVDPKVVPIAAHVCRRWLQHISFHLAPAEVLAPSWSDFDLLYLDGPNDPQCHADVFANLTERPAYILVDDVLECERYTVKGEKVIPLALANGYRLEFCANRQALLVRDDVA